MHLIIPFAASSSQGYADALAKLQLPMLQKLLARLSPLPADIGDELSLSPPHERALAAALGLKVSDGQIPLAALHAQQTCHSAAPHSAWAFISLCHWQVTTGQVAMSPLPPPALSPAQSDALLAAMQPYFEEDGIRLYADQPGRWLAQGEVFAELATASPDRVVGRNLADWMNNSAQAATLRRLQNEMQMLLYTHPVNDARDTMNLPTVNSFWIHGSGALPVGYQPPAARERPVLIPSLRESALADNWSDWLQAWQALDAEEIQALLQATAARQPVRLTLCGERGSRSWHIQPQPVWQKLKGFLGPKPLSVLFKEL